MFNENYGTKIEYWPNGNIRSKRYMLLGYEHRTDGPSYYAWYENGKKHIEWRKRYGNFHCENGPAVLEWYQNGQLETEAYYINNNYHRENGPVLQEWFSNGQIKTMEFRRHGTPHRIDGPAIIDWNHNKSILHREYWVDGILLQPEWFTQLGKDINKDLSDETVRNMIVNIYGAIQ